MSCNKEVHDLGCYKVAPDTPSEEDMLSEMLSIGSNKLGYFVFGERDDVYTYELCPDFAAREDFETSVERLLDNVKDQLRRANFWFVSYTGQTLYENTFVQSTRAMYINLIDHRTTALFVGPGGVRKKTFPGVYNHKDAAYGSRKGIR